MLLEYLEVNVSNDNGGIIGVLPICLFYYGFGMAGVVFADVNLYQQTREIVYFRERYKDKWNGIVFYESLGS